MALGSAATSVLASSPRATDLGGWPRPVKIIFAQNALSCAGGEELIGHSIWEVFPMNEETELQQQNECCLREQRSAAFEMLSPVTGILMDLRVYPTKQGLAAYFRDIGKRKRTEKPMREETQV
jgi:hypothetical protein